MLPKQFKSMLRDCDISQLQRSDPLVIQRIFSFGDVEDMRNLLQHVSQKKIKATLPHIRNSTDRRTQQFLKYIFNINLPIKNKNEDSKRQKNIPTRNIG